jgi:hypothetical protein
MKQKVYEADEARGRVTVKLIPRIDFSIKAMQPEEKDPDKKRKKIRPPQRFFNGEEMRFFKTQTTSKFPKLNFFFFFFQQWPAPTTR